MYAEQPEGYAVPHKGDCKLVWKLKKSLYGLKQSGRNWNNLLHTHLWHDDFRQSDADPCVYNKTTKDGRVMVIFWVDDIIMAASNKCVLNSVKASLSQKFRMQDLGELHWFLGIAFQRTDDCVIMSQKKYLAKVLKKFGLKNCQLRKSPCDEGLAKEPGSSPPLSDPKLYREIVRSLIHAMTVTRPDLSCCNKTFSKNVSSINAKC